MDATFILQIIGGAYTLYQQYQAAQAAGDKEAMDRLNAQANAAADLLMPSDV